MLPNLFDNKDISSVIKSHIGAEEVLRALTVYIDLKNNPLNKKELKHINKEEREFEKELTVCGETLKFSTYDSHRYEWNKYLENRNKYSFNFKTQLLDINLWHHFQRDSNFTKKTLKRGDKDYDLYFGKMYNAVFKLAWKKYKSTKKRKWIDELEDFALKKMCTE